MGWRPQGSRHRQKQPSIINSHLADEFYVTLLRQAIVQVESLAKKQGGTELFNVLLVFSLMSGYLVPGSKALHEGIYHWLLQVRAGLPGMEAVKKMIARALNNFRSV